MKYRDTIILQSSMIFTSVAEDYMREILAVRFWRDTVFSVCFLAEQRWLFWKGLGGGGGVGWG